MSERLKGLIGDYLLRTGKNARAKLAVASELSVSTVTAIMRDDHVPQPYNIVKLALACGLNEQEALRLAREVAEPAAVREPA